MRLLKLVLKDYRVLKDLTVHFDREGKLASTRNYGLDFLVGVNGTGKSTVLRALVELFRYLEQGVNPPFPFSLQYQVMVGDMTVKVTAENTEGALRRTTEPANAPGDLIPRVLAFTTGSEAEWLEEATPFYATEDAQDLDQYKQLSPATRFLTEVPGYKPSVRRQKPQANSRVRVVRTATLPLLVLSGWLADVPRKERVLRDVFAAARIQGIAGFSFRLRVPPDNQEARRRLVGKLAACSSGRQRQGAERLLVFDCSDARAVADRVTEKFGSVLRFFEVLEDLAVPDPDEPPCLREVSLFLERSTAGAYGFGLKGTEQEKLHLFEWLSDGEQNFIGRLALFSLLGESDSLVLLDEPEVHFNDFWKRQMVYYLDRALQQNHSHAVIATHSSVALTDVQREDVHVLERSGAFTKTSGQPRIETFASDPSDILVHVFGAQEATGKYSARYMQKLLGTDHGEVPEDRTARLRRLKEIVPQVAPGYWNYRIRREIERLEAGGRHDS